MYGRRLSVTSLDHTATVVPASAFCLGLIGKLILVTWSSCSRHLPTSDSVRPRALVENLEGVLGTIPPVMNFPQTTRKERAHNHSRIASSVTVLVGDYYVCPTQSDQLKALGWLLIAKRWPATD